MSFRCIALLLSGLALAGCASQAEIAQAQAQIDRYDCLEQGFEEGTDSFALCRLILQTNHRLDALSRRLVFLETDVQRLDLWRFPSRRCC